MRLEALFELIDLRAKAGTPATCIHLTPQNEVNLRKGLLDEPVLLGDVAAARLREDDYYIRKLLRTIGGIPVVWCAEAFRMS